MRKERFEKKVKKQKGRKKDVYKETKNPKRKKEKLE